MGTATGKKLKYENSYFCKKEFCKKLIKDDDSLKTTGIGHKENTAFLVIMITPWHLEKYTQHIADVRSLAQARIRSMPTELVETCEKGEESLINEVRNLIAKKSFSPALRYLTFAIEKCRSEKLISDMNYKERLHLYRVYIKRAQLYQLMNLKFKKLRYANLALEDCKFLNAFESDLKKIDDGALYKNLKTIEQNANEFIASRVSSSNNQNINGSVNKSRRSNQNHGNRRSRQNNSNNNQRSTNKPVKEVYALKIL